MLSLTGKKVTCTLSLLSLCLIVKALVRIQYLMIMR